MKYSVVRASDLDAGQRARWLALQRSNPDLASPYFCPEFTTAVSLVRDDVRVTVMEDGGGISGYFPFQRSRLGVGRPVGGGLSDYHGVVTAQKAELSVPDLLRHSGLGLWHYDHLVAAQTPFAAYHRRLSVSPGLALSEGYAAYRRSLVAAGSGRFAQLERKSRKLAREVGPLRFEPQTTDSRVLSRVVALKRQQCLRTGVVDFFAFPWTQALVERISEAREPHFAGALSALYAGEELVAAHLGMYSERAWHWWFPVYEHSFAKYSPGALLLLGVAEEAAARGIALLDLGKGDDAYKSSFSNTDTPLAEGCASRRSLGAALRWGRETGERAIRALPLGEPVRAALRRLRQWERQRGHG